jgi:hypothetical protein
MTKGRKMRHGEQEWSKKGKGKLEQGWRKKEI